MDVPYIKKEDWDRKQFEWKNKPFYRVRYGSFFGLPLTLDIQRKKALEKLRNRKLLPGKPVILTKNNIITSKLYIEMTHADENTEHETFSGNYFTMSFEGKTNNFGLWKKILKQVCETNSLHVKEILPYFAKHEDSKKELTVLLARVTPASSQNI